ncbi:MAG: lipopolysaccharide biosynthesis protein [Phormidesmis sp.]
MSLRQKVIHGTLWSAIESWGAQLASTAVFLLLARLLGAEAFGLVALASVFLAFMQLFLDQGFSLAIIQRDNIETAHLDTAFWTSVLMAALFVLGTVSGAGFVANFYSEPSLAPIIQWMSLSFLFGGLSSIQSAVLRRNMQFKKLAARSLVATVACGIAGVGAAYMGLGVWSLVIKEIVFGLTGAILLWSTSDWRPGFKFSIRHFQELFSFGISIIGFNFLDFFNRRADDLLIGYFLGAVALGYYSVAYRILMIMMGLLTKVISQVALPAFSRIQKEPERMSDAFYQATKYTNLVSFPIFLGIAVLAPELITILFGEAWLPSVLTMQILAFIGIIQSMQYLTNTVFLAMNKPLWRLKIILLTTVCSVIGFWIVVRWGIAAVAICYVALNYLFAPISLILVKRLIKIDIRQYLLQYRAPLLSALIMGGCIFGMKQVLHSWPHPYINLTVYVAGGAIAYLLSIAFFFPDLFNRIYKLTLATASHPTRRK